MNNNKLTKKQELILIKNQKEQAEAFSYKFNQLAAIIHGFNSKWWYDINTGKRLVRDKLNMLMLIVTEIAEAAEGERKDKMDDHLPKRKMAEVELADAIIRICDYACAHGYDLDGAIKEKLIYNLTRKDHTAKERRKKNGKKY